MSDWIEWNGGECPVEKGTLVDVKHRDGEVFTNQLIGVKGECKFAVNWNHEDYNQFSDIIAYRLHKPKQESKPLTQQLARAVKKRAKHRAKLDKWSGEVERLKGEVEREIEEATGCICSVSEDVHALKNKYVISGPYSDRIKISGVESAISADVDPDDPKTWRAGDVVECVESQEPDLITVGRYYEFDWPDDNGIAIKEDDEGDALEMHPEDAKFRFVRRPSEG